MNNLAFYGEFMLDEDIVSQLEAYVLQRQYHNTVVDLMLHSLASATRTTCVIISMWQGVVQETVVEPREGIESACKIHLCKVGPHYDAVLKTSSASLAGKCL